MEKRVDISKYSLKNYGNKMYINTITKKAYMYSDIGIILVKNKRVLIDIFKVFKIK